MNLPLQAPAVIREAYSWQARPHRQIRAADWVQVGYGGGQQTCSAGGHTWCCNDPGPCGSWMCQCK
jgi:hypothetical protein